MIHLDLQPQGRSSTLRRSLRSANMKIPYKSQNPSAGIVNYELLPSAIILEFTGGKHRYLYNDNAPGPEHVEAMKHLARQGQGLTTYVNQHVRDRYAGKLPLSRKKPSG